jgi:hypothetical protein
MQVPIILKLILNMFSCNFFICFSWIESCNAITVSFLSVSLCYHSIFLDKLDE